VRDFSRQVRADADSSRYLRSSSSSSSSSSWSTSVTSPTPANGQTAIRRQSSIIGGTYVCFFDLDVWSFAELRRVEVVNKCSHRMSPRIRVLGETLALLRSDIGAARRHRSPTNGVRPFQVLCESRAIETGHVGTEASLHCAHYVCCYQLRLRCT
jgi:hypothetical protein